MNQLQVLKKLIPIYKKAINRIADGEDAESVCMKTETTCGICWCANQNGFYIYCEYWVKEINGYDWYDIPNYNYKHAIECLSYRLTIMQLMVEDLTKK